MTEPEQPETVVEDDATEVASDETAEDAAPEPTA